MSKTEPNAPELQLQGWMGGGDNKKARRALEENGWQLAAAADALYREHESIEGGGVRWFSVDPRTRHHIPYDDVMQATLESAYQDPTADKTNIPFHIGNTIFRVDISSPPFMQYNNVCLGREVYRQGPPTQARVSNLPSPFEACLQIVERIDTYLEGVEKDLSRKPEEPSLSEEEKLVVFDVYRMMLQGFALPVYQKRYEASRSSLEHIKLEVGFQVPRYFANLKEGDSMFRRKVLSMLGLRNLILHGWSIYGELHDQKFTSDLYKYPEGKGVHKMLEMTGNTVDLDTVVLRSEDEFKRRKAEGTHTHDSHHAFGDSAEAKLIALRSALPLLHGFCEDFKLSEVEQHQRCVFLPEHELESYKMPQASCSEDRGRFPVWQYINFPLTNSFHANVPVLPDVIGALLKSPWHAVKAYCTIMLRYSKSPTDLQRKLEDFYERCIEDSCFNAKWKNIEMYNQELSRMGTISYVLEHLQKEHQVEFSKIYDSIPPEKQDAEEVKLMCSLVAKLGLSGRNKAGMEVPITDDMVAQWVDNPAQEF